MKANHEATHCKICLYKQVCEGEAIPVHCDHRPEQPAVFQTPLQCTSVTVACVWRPLHACVACTRCDRVVVGDDVQCKQ